ncbi:alpha/beta hydrolase [Streptomyces sp. NPDC053542]|uniref:alpha/beta hydrolase n=1 Tax=Streptomyces sp. NPDC053542 TaxID=3365710 RepID=UPI0037D1A980
MPQLLPSEAPPTPPDDPVRAVEVEAGPLRLSGLLALPTGVPPRAVLVALHGGGMRAGYFHGRADPATSMLSLAASCGYAALALDRPGYGSSAAALPDGLPLAEQAGYVLAALESYAREHPVGAGFFLLGHSMGGKLALMTAARDGGDGDGQRLLGIDVSGISDRWAVGSDRLADPAGRRSHRLHWGPLALYPPGTFRMAEPLVGPIPRNELRDVPCWPRTYPSVAREVRVPVRFTFAEHEQWWRSDRWTVEAMTARLAAPLVRVDRLACAGHNISLGRTARGYHLGVLAFLEECVARAEGGAP